MTSQTCHLKLQHTIPPYSSFLFTLSLEIKACVLSPPSLFHHHHHISFICQCCNQYRPPIRLMSIHIHTGATFIFQIPLLVPTSSCFCFDGPPFLPWQDSNFILYFTMKNFIANGKISFYNFL